MSSTIEFAPVQPQVAPELPIEVPVITQFGPTPELTALTAAATELALTGLAIISAKKEKEPAKKPDDPPAETTPAGLPKRVPGQKPNPASKPPGYDPNKQE